MLFEREIQGSFEKNATEYLGRDFEKHRNYLLKAVFGRNSSMIPEHDLDEILSVYTSNPDKCVDNLYRLLKPVIEKTMGVIHSRGLSLKARYENDSLILRDNGGEKIEVQSERSHSKFYTVNLKALECTCPYYEKVKFAGMLCKHIFFANEMLGDKYRNSRQDMPEVRDDPAESSEILAVKSTSSHFRYGHQRLTKRPRRGNSLIPSGITYILEGKGPEVVIYALESGESLLLVGESGVGKSKMIQYLAQETNTP
ncbi:hypothetical protein GF312_21975, partial [Candidatus Poribacteria bacterium]|nr:hypothetical protein [Candidatus Poribacteria bacterium]